MPMPASHQRRQFAKNVYSSFSNALMNVEQQAEMLPLGKGQQTPCSYGMSTPSASTVCSSNGGSNYNSEDEVSFEFDGDSFSSPCKSMSSYH